MPHEAAWEGAPRGCGLSLHLSGTCAGSSANPAATTSQVRALERTAMRRLQQPDLQSRLKDFRSLDV
eukprot:scaffold1727_cov119-Isochrysis_galbana.AAC.12